MVQSDDVDATAISQAGRLAKAAAGIWFGGWLVSFLMAGFFGSGSGETAPLVVFAVVGFILLIGMISSVLSLRLAVRAIRLNSDSWLAKVTFGLDCASLLFAVLVGGWILSDFVG